jgi:hypothetical protein
VNGLAFRQYTVEGARPPVCLLFERGKLGDEVCACRTRITPAKSRAARTIAFVSRGAGVRRAAELLQLGNAGFESVADYTTLDAALIAASEKDTDRAVRRYLGAVSKSRAQ